MRLLDFCANKIRPTRRSLFWILCGSAISMTSLAVIKAYNSKKGTQLHKRLNDCSESSKDATLSETGNRIQSHEMTTAHTKFLIEQLSLTDTTNDRLIISLLVTLSDRLAENPYSDHFDDDRFVQTLSRLCNSENANIRESALFTTCNLCRSSHIAKYKHLLNVLFARLRYARYILDFNEMLLILNCLCNVALTADTGKYFVPSLEVIAELISHQGESKLSRARLAAWKLLVNLSNIPLIIPYMMNMPWQWMVAIECDLDCETRRLLFFSNLLKYFPMYYELMRKIHIGSLIAVLMSPLIHTQLKESFKPSQTDTYHINVSKRFLLNLEIAFNACDGPRRLDELKSNTEKFPEESAYLKFGDFSNCFFSASMLFPDPKKQHDLQRKQQFPYMFSNNWRNSDLRNACAKLCHWYNNLAVRCDFPIHDSLPYRVKLVQNFGKYLDEDFIGELTCNWTVHPFFEEKTTEIQVIASDLSSNFPVDRCDLPPEILGPELQNKQVYSHFEAIKVLDRMNLILDELAILCPPFYCDVMRIRELPYLNSAMDYRPEAVHSMSKENIFVLNYCSLPLAKSIVPHRPFIFGIDETVDLNIKEFARIFACKVKQEQDTIKWMSDASNSLHSTQTGCQVLSYPEYTSTSLLVGNQVNKHIRRCFGNRNVNIRNSDESTSGSSESDDLREDGEDSLENMNVSDDAYSENDQEPNYQKYFADECDAEVEKLYDCTKSVKFVKFDEKHQRVAGNVVNPPNSSTKHCRSITRSSSIRNNNPDCHPHSYFDKPHGFHSKNGKNRKSEYNSFTVDFDCDSNKKTVCNGGLLSNLANNYYQQYKNNNPNGIDDFDFVSKFSQDIMARVIADASRKIDQDDDDDNDDNSAVCNGVCSIPMPTSMPASINSSMSHQTEIDNSAVCNGVCSIHMPTSINSSMSHQTEIDNPSVCNGVCSIPMPTSMPTSINFSMSHQTEIDNSAVCNGVCSIHMPTSMSTSINSSMSHQTEIDNSAVCNGVCSFDNISKQNGDTDSIDYDSNVDK